MIRAVSCGGVVIHRGKVILLYKNQSGNYVGWVLPRGTVEEGESFRQTALREVKEESGIDAKIIKYIGKTQYTFKGHEDYVDKTVHWYLMSADSFYCKPQAEEFFADAGFYKRHEAYHLLKFYDEKQIMLKAYDAYYETKRQERSGKHTAGKSLDSKGSDVKNEDAQDAGVNDESAKDESIKGVDNRISNSQYHKKRGTE